MAAVLVKIDAISNDVVSLSFWDEGKHYLGGMQAHLGLVVAFMQAGARAALHIAPEGQDRALPSMESVVRMSIGEFL